ncbi:PBS lyase HEAT repeat-like domain protein [Myxococcus xanthus DK 1622]|uniref:PBS lyase HEAT repeat-like domain protein n=1 Tax=Myxococcus xanthus (strain DK1622) TaxID=246197 RepID=Q1DC29_MYXXD|nr:MULTISPECIES: HEAT repeat domain-containing protein [Myxococcus]ABF86579.1 PBS lyase HEAT repeat-like domain protein [Myxococcus xanthus DK 1622]NOJ51876.1 HEAT repeat domain-containing protein [Myxococcus xanthus]QPM81172.1 HEAT repeat domain-containing protein [Myxococcus xanthus]QVW70231.1 HEAT repeat domain-containing protein [Myxococcus xanthus DZ2]QZZ49068.1 hypothetical protein MyxoNM_07650 [Myxococcus xanthus]
MKDIVGSDRRAIVNAATLLSGDPTTTGELLELLKVENRAEPRQGILHALSWHGDLRTWGLMVRILADDNEDPKVRGQAAEGLAYMFDLVKADSPEFELAVKTLLEALSDPSLEVRYNAIFAIGATKHPPLIPALEALLGDSTPVPGWGDTIGRKAADAIEWLAWSKSS